MRRFIRLSVRGSLLPAAAAAAGVAAVSVAAAAGLSGCTKAANKPLTQSEKDMMRQPAGSVPMPAEAAEAMKRGRTAPPPPGTPPGTPPPGPPAAAGGR